MIHGDTNTNNYNDALNKVRIGEAIWETSSAGNTSNSSWYGDYSYFSNTSYPFMYRGGNFYNGSSAGAFAFNFSLGSAIYNYGFRAVLAGVSLWYKGDIISCIIFLNSGVLVQGQYRKNIPKKHNSFL